MPYILPLNLQFFSEGDDTGVEQVPAAGEQTETVEQPVQGETGVEVTGAADQIKDEKDFSAALKAREEQLRRQIEKEYGEKYQTVETQAQMLDRVAKYYGYENHNEFQQAFEQAEREKQAKEEAQRLGMDEEAYLKYLQPVNEKLTQYEQTIHELKQKEMQRQIESEVVSLTAKYPDFEENKGKVFDIAIQKGYSLEDAYILATYQTKLEKVGKEKEQEVIANITRRDQSQILSSNDKPGDVQFDPAKMSLKDIEEISRRVQSGERITF